MDESSRSDTKLAWLWAIEYLASFPQIDPSILHDLIDEAPEGLPEDLGKSTRERVALRCMEHLSSSNNVVAKNGPSAANLKHTFDVSESCEDVLLSILKETSVSDLRMATPDLLKWDVQPFIMNKRTSMPKCALEQMKDAILEGSNSYPASLVEASGLMHKDVESDGIPLDSSRRIDSNGTDTRIMAPEGSPISLPLENNQGVMGDYSHHQNLLPMKRNENYLANENHACNLEDQGGIDDGDLHLCSKRLKCNASNVNEPREQILDPQYGKLVKESFKEMIGGTEKESLPVERESQGRGLGECKSVENGHNKFVASARNGRSPDADAIDAVQHNRCHSADGANKMPQSSCGDGCFQDVLAGKINENSAPSMRTLQEVSVDSTRDNSDCGNHKKLPNAISSSGFPREMTVESSEDSTQHLSEEDTSNGDDDYHFEKFDVAVQRSRFLSSRCTLSHASLSDWTELDLCVICSEDAQLLVCNAVGCPLVVHDKCLGCSPKFDKKGNFYCPFCVYAYAIAKYIEAKKKAAAARKELLTFIRQFPEGLHSKEHHVLKQNRDEVLPNKIHESENLREKDSYQTINAEHAYKVNDQLGEKKGENEPEEPIVLHTNVNLMHGEDEPDVTHVRSSISPGVKESERTDLECPSARGHDRQDQACSDSKCNISNASSKNKKIRSLKQREPGVIQKEVLEQQSSDMLEKPVCADNVDEGRTSSAENEENEVSNHSLRLRRTEKQYTYPAIPQLRRKKVPWTVEEEEMLKEGVQKFSTISERSIPWKKILEYGGPAFWSGRTPMDLKDKWRNMCKGSPKCR